MNFREMLTRSSRRDVVSLLASLSANLDWRDFGAWPAQLRVGLGAASFAVALAVGGWVVFGGMAARNDALEAEEGALRAQLASSARQVANLDQTAVPRRGAREGLRGPDGHGSLPLPKRPG